MVQNRYVDVSRSSPLFLNKKIGVGRPQHREYGAQRQRTVEKDTHCGAISPKKLYQFGQPRYIPAPHKTNEMAYSGPSKHDAHP
jgi:hypothetical protein